MTAGSKRRLRILHVVPTYYPAVRYGGPIRSVHGLATALVRRGHDVHVYTTNMDGPGDLDVPLDRPVDIDGVQVNYFRVPPLRTLRRLHWSPDLHRRLRESVAEFDIVQLHSVYLMPTWAGARAASRAAVPYIVTPHGMLIRDLIRAKSRWVKTAWIALVERTTLSRATALHVTAELEGSEIRALGLPLPRIVSEVPNGVDWPQHPLPFEQVPYGHLPPRYALFLSRINWKKGLDRLITAWQKVPDVPLVIAGNDEEGYLPELKRLTQSLGLTDRVLFIGPVSDQHKWAVFERAELFLLPSYSENFGIVVAEAMVMGCPVLVTPEVGMARFVESARGGVVTSNDPSNLASAISALLADEPRRREMGRCGKQAVRAHLSWDHVVEQMEELYESAMRQGAPTGVTA